MGDLIAVTKKHPLYEKKKALTALYGYEPPSSKVEAEDYLNKSGSMYEWSKDDLTAALEEYKKKYGSGDISDEDAQALENEERELLAQSIGEDKDYTYEFDSQEKADEFEAAYQELLKETDAEKQFNLTMQNLPNYGRDWQYSDTEKETDYTKNENLGLYQPTAEQERPMTNADVVAALARLKTPSATKKYSEKTNQEKEEDWLKMFGGGEL
jgi:hypothetical protein